MIDKGANKMEHITREAAYHDTCSDGCDRGYDQRGDGCGAGVRRKEWKHGIMRLSALMAIMRT